MTGCPTQIRTKWAKVGSFIALFLLLSGALIYATWILAGPDFLAGSYGFMCLLIY